jgi:xanthine dehydrogenase accessory factor
MSSSTKDLCAFLDAAPASALVEVAEAKGSTPREKGAWMLVSPTAIFGTIGGGQLEFMAIDKAREVLAGVNLYAVEAGAAPHRAAIASDRPRPLHASGDSEAPALRPSSFSPFTGRRSRQGDEGRRRPLSDVAPHELTLDIPLGPEIGQCCGGRVEVAISLVDDAKRETLIEMAKAEDRSRPHVYIFGGGHVGHALASSFALLPVNAVVVETRADALAGMPDSVETRLTPVPEEMVREAPANAAFVVLTHDHALDFLIVAEALKRGDAAYVGMIGSKTKKATFRSWYLKAAGGSEADFARLVSPIGGGAVKDKRPAVIAALAAAEIMTALLAHQPVTAET